MGKVTLHEHFIPYDKVDGTEKFGLLVLFQNVTERLSIPTDKWLVSNTVNHGQDEL